MHTCYRLLACLGLSLSFYQGTAATLTGTSTLTEADCQTLSDSIGKQIPAAVGDSTAIKRMFEVQADDWLPRLNVDALLEIIQAKFRNAATFPEDNLIGKLSDDDSVLSYNLHRGEARYINRAMMQVINDGSTAIDPRTGLSLVEKLLSTTGISTAQANLDAVHSNVLKAGIISPQEQQLPSEKFAIDIERTFFVPRQINGMRVEGSRFVVGINNQGMVSRFRVRWPPLVLADDVDTSLRTVVSRDEMQKQILAELMGSETTCNQAPEVLTMQLAYVPVELGDGDEGDAKLNQTAAVKFRPQLLVNYMPGSQEEGGRAMQFNLY